ncbi:MAG: hypothetical protein LIP01_08705 [Tannerellaceae bacterium]|nr:hypothetical protein [Tannerellaceae bacterium]
MVEDGKERLVGSDELDFFYVSGQNTKKLTINPEYVSKMLFRCKAEYYEGTVPTSPTDTAAEAETKFRRRYPKSLYIKVNVRTGETVLATTSTIKAEAIVGTKTGVIGNPEQFFHIRWYRNTLTSGSTDMQIGRGVALSVDRATLGLGVSERPRLIAKAEEHDPYMALTDKEGNILTDENGNILVGF